MYGNDEGIVKAFRNLPGLDLCHVDRLNLLQLAPGGHVGRFIIWTESAVAKLDSIYGTGECGSSSKKRYAMPKNIISNSDVNRIINSDEVQSVIRPVAERKMYVPRKKNALKNKDVMLKLNPYAKIQKSTKDKKTAVPSSDKSAGKAFYEKMMAN